MRLHSQLCKNDCVRKQGQVGRTKTQSFRPTNPNKSSVTKPCRQALRRKHEAVHASLLEAHKLQLKRQICTRLINKITFFFWSTELGIRKIWS